MEDNKYIVKKGLFGVRYLYLDEKTRVRYGFSFRYSGMTYTLQREKTIWIEKAWTYASTHSAWDIERVIDYLEWYEKKHENKCLF